MTHIWGKLLWIAIVVGSFNLVFYAMFKLDNEKHNMLKANIILIGIIGLYLMGWFLIPLWNK